MALHVVFGPTGEVPVADFRKHGRLGLSLLKWAKVMDCNDILGRPVKAFHLFVVVFYKKLGCHAIECIAPRSPGKRNLHWEIQTGGSVCNGRLDGGRIVMAACCFQLGQLPSIVSILACPDQVVRLQS